MAMFSSIVFEKSCQTVCGACRGGVPRRRRAVAYGGGDRAPRRRRVAVTARRGAPRRATWRALRCGAARAAARAVPRRHGMRRTLAATRRHGHKYVPLNIITYNCLTTGQSLKHSSNNYWEHFARTDVHARSCPTAGAHACAHLYSRPAAHAYAYACVLVQVRQRMRSPNTGVMGEGILSKVIKQVQFC